MQEKKTPVRIAIFASGKGSNAGRIIDYFEKEHKGTGIAVCLIVSNKSDAAVLDIARKEGIPHIILDKERFFKSDDYIDELKAAGIDFVVLAGFLWKVPMSLIKAYPDKILNIHPALLPKYGGKGMYGMFVHEAVIADREKQSGITIHYVDEFYDHGRIFFQAAVAIDENETANSLAMKIHQLEYSHFPKQIEKWIESKISLKH